MLSQVLIPIAFCGSAFLANFIQIRAYVRHQVIKRNGVKTTAKIISHSYIHEQLEGQEYLDTSKTRRVTTIEFEVDAKQYAFEEDIGRAADFLKVGQEAPLWYLPHDPNRHVLGKGVTIWSTLGVFFLSVPFLVMGLWVLLGSS
jgi:hypothetical protein